MAAVSFGTEVRSVCSEVMVKHLDPHAPLVVDTRELGRRPGSMRELSRAVAAPAGLGNDVIGVLEGSELRLEVRLESVMEGVLLTGTAQVITAGECVRCLEPLRGDREFGFQELYAYPAQRSAEELDDDEIVRLEDDLIDLEPLLRDTLILALPMQPLCQEDCPGLCPECGIRLVEHPGHQHDVTDPRWAALQSLTESGLTGPGSTGNSATDHGLTDHDVLDHGVTDVYDEEKEG